MHDNGRTGEPPDLAKLIDYAGAVVVACQTLEQLARAAAHLSEPESLSTSTRLLSAATDASDALWYVRRALEDLRSLV